MAQRMHSLSKWTLVEEGQAVHYVNPRGRPVAIDVNSPTEVAFYVIQDLEDIEENPAIVADKAAGRFQADRDRLGAVRATLDSAPATDQGKAADITAVAGRAVTFLALVKGRDRLEFSVDGEFDLMVEGGACNIYTVDSADVATRVIDPIIFTRVANRRVRNPELEWMMYQQRRNQEALMGSMAREMDRRMAEMEKGLKKRYVPQRETALPPERAAKAGLLKGKPLERSESDNGEDGKGKEKKGETGTRTKVRAPSLENREGED